jgi:catechol 2,3-dioxygenase-like lactoylglutathione lyase family enzyme
MPPGAEPVIEPEGIDFVVIPTRDREAASRFYGGTLGFRPRPTADPRFPEFDTANVTLMLVEPQQFGREFTPLSAGAIAIRVDDVEAARTRLEHAGVTFRGATYDSGHCLEAFFTDPDGNGLLLHRRYAP